MNTPPLNTPPRTLPPGQPGPVSVLSLAARALAVVLAYSLPVYVGQAFVDSYEASIPPGAPAFSGLGAELLLLGGSWLAAVLGVAVVLWSSRRAGLPRAWAVTSAAALVAWIVIVRQSLSPHREAFWVRELPMLALMLAITALLPPVGTAPTSRRRLMAAAAAVLLAGIVAPIAVPQGQSRPAKPSDPATGRLEALSPRWWAPPFSKYSAHDCAWAAPDGVTYDWYTSPSTHAPVYSIEQHPSSSPASQPVVIQRSPAVIRRTTGQDELTIRSRGQDVTATMTFVKSLTLVGAQAMYTFGC